MVSVLLCVEDTHPRSQPTAVTTPSFCRALFIFTLQTERKSPVQGRTKVNFYWHVTSNAEYKEIPKSSMPKFMHFVILWQFSTIIIYCYCSFPHYLSLCVRVCNTLCMDLFVNLLHSKFSNFSQQWLDGLERSWWRFCFRLNWSYNTNHVSMASTIQCFYAIQESSSTILELSRKNFHYKYKPSRW